MATTLDVVRIRPVMPSRANLDGCSTACWQDHTGHCVGRDLDLDLDPPRLDRPRAPGQAIRSNVLYASMRETGAWTWPHIKLAIPRSCRRQTAHCAMQPIGHGSQGVVVERGHLSGIDRAVRKEAVPALPDGGRPHRHRIEPRRAFALDEQVKGSLNLPDAAQSITYQRRPHEAGPDVVSTFAYKCHEPFGGMLTLLGIFE